LSFLLGIGGMIGAAFVVALVLAFLLPNRWITIGWVLAALAAAFAAVRQVTDPRAAEIVDIPYAALWAALGAFPGAALGSAVHKLLKRSR
jgi:prolipoprotein diacylglyceryltransferase